MRRSRIGAVVLVALAAAAGGGCGDDGDGGGLSKSELDKRATAICEEGDAKLEAIAEPADISDPNQAATFLAAVLEAANDQIAKLKELEPAEDLKANYDAYIAELEESQGIMEGILAKARAKDPSGLQELQQVTQEGTREKAVNDAATKAGVAGCATDR